MVKAIFSTWGFLALCALRTACAQTPYKVQKPPLDTDWTYEVGTDPWPEHPRPQLRREAWKSLNGIWTWSAAKSNDDLDNPPEAGSLDHEVLVPSCIESGLSGLQILDVHYMWYETSFEVPENWDGQNVLLNFEAVDYRATVIINGEKKDTHVGGYSRISLDITKDVKFGEKNSLLVFVHDPTDDEVIPIGKQTLNPSHIFYRPCSGIWQQVWVEAIPKDYINRLDVAANGDGEVTMNVLSSTEGGADVKVVFFDQNGKKKSTHSGKADKEFTFSVKGVKKWWPDSPTLYNFTVTLGKDDEVNSYTGFRTISKGEVEGVTRNLLNGEFVFQFGTLDQGYWPDGLYTPPNYEAMVYDLKILKDLGMNMVRKHIKIEPDLFYQACDKLGLLVIQDMPALKSNAQPNEAEQAEFQRQLEIMVNEHKSYPSIGTWMIYNEGWGQLNEGEPEKGLTEIVRKLDPSRLIDSVSGWNDHGFGDYHDNHNYAHPQCGTPFYSLPKTPYDPKRIALQGEYGGIGHNVSIEQYAIPNFYKVMAFEHGTNMNDLSLWNVQKAIDAIAETYEINKDLDSYDYRSMVLFRDLREQTQKYACSGAVYTQTTDVEGEVNGLVTYDRRLMRPRKKNWQKWIQSLYDAAASRGGRPVKHKG